MAWSCASGQWGVSDDEASSLRHYFLYRGLYNTSKAFENELKQDREKAFRVDKIMDQILQYIVTYDILALRDYWNFLEMRIFSSIDSTLSENVTKLYRGLLRYYVTHAHQQGKSEKVVEFFDKMSVELSSNAEWKEWFEKPAVLGFEEDKKKIDSLEFENAKLKRRIEELSSRISEDIALGQRGSNREGWSRVPSAEIISDSNLEFLDDFQELNNSRNNGSSSNGLKSTSSSAPISSLPLMSFLKNFAGSSVSSKKNFQLNHGIGRGSDCVVERAESRASDVQRSYSVGSKILTANSCLVDAENNGIISSSQIVAEQINEPIPQPDYKNQDYSMLSQEIYADHAASVVTCRFSSTGKSVVSLDADGILKIWSCLPSPKTISGTMSKSVLTTIEWLPASDRFLLLGSKVGDIRLFDSKERKVIKDAHVEVNFPKLNSIAIHPDGSSFVTSSHGRVVSGSSLIRMSQFRMGLLTLWDLNSDIKQKRFLPISPCPVAINSITYNQSGNLLLTGGCDGRIRVYDIYSVSFASNSAGSCFSFAADGSLVQWSLEKAGHKLNQFDLYESNSCRGLCNASGSGRSFLLNSSNSNVLVGWENTAAIYKISPNFDLKNYLAIGDGSSTMTCVDWSEHRSPNICLVGTNSGNILVTSLLVKTSS